MARVLSARLPPRLQRSATKGSESSVMIGSFVVGRYGASPFGSARTAFAPLGDKRIVFIRSDRYLDDWDVAKHGICLTFGKFWNCGVARVIIAKRSVLQR